MGYDMTQWIQLAGAGQVHDAKGRLQEIVRVEIHTQGFLPDVYVRFTADVLAFALYEDRAVIAHVMSVLRCLGYTGRAFDHAELGMQGKTFIVLEPGTDFRRFVIERYRWRDMSSNAKAY